MAAKQASAIPLTGAQNQRRRRPRGLAPPHHHFDAPPLLLSDNPPYGGNRLHAHTSRDCSETNDLVSLTQPSAVCRRACGQAGCVRAGCVHVLPMFTTIPLRHMMMMFPVNIMKPHYSARTVTVNTCQARLTADAYSYMHTHIHTHYNTIRRVPCANAQLHSRPGNLRRIRTHARRGIISKEATEEQ